MNIQKNQKNSLDKKGFTLIETMIAIFILLVSITGPLTFAQSGLRASFFARDQITAFYLAQDAIETLKNLRDDSGLTPGETWLDDFDFGGSGGCQPTSNPAETAVCNFDVNPEASILKDNSCTPSCTGSGCASATCNKLRYNQGTKRFTLFNSVDPLSKYTRTIFVTQTVPGQEVQIIVKVSWDSNFFGTKEVIAQENIYNWVTN